MQDDIAISVEHVSKDFILPQEKITSVKSAFTGFYKRGKKVDKNQHALKDISFEIKKGEFFGIVGRNGSGKSTMLKILANIYQPTRGNVTTHGKLVPFIELGVGFNPELTGRENIYLNGAMLGFSRKEIDVMYDDIVSFAELEKFMYQKLKNYSSGMQVRIAFSMAIRSEAEILLIDEVLAVGDADFRRKCFDYFQQLKGSDTTVVFVSHNMNDIREYCSRALLIDQNRIVEIGNPDEIAKQYSRLFLEGSKTAAKPKHTKRWGNQSVSYDEVFVDSEGTTGTEKVVIRGVLTANRYTEACIIGFAIKSATGTALVGTNSLIEGQQLEKLQQGQSIEFEWEVPNIFTDGGYVIDATCSLASGEESDWWEGAAGFNVVREIEHAPYPVSPPITLRLDTHAREHDAKKRKRQPQAGRT